MAEMTEEPIILSSWIEVQEAFRRRELRQALYDEGAVVMADCLLSLHGAEHRDRRRLENRLFRKEVFVHWEREVLGGAIAETLTPFVADGSGDLIVLGYRTTMNLTALIAGIDRQAGTATETEHLYTIVKKLSEGATLVHSTRDHDEVRDEVRAALAVFDAEFLQPSIARRAALIDEVTAGERPETDLPRDVLTTLLCNQDKLDLAPDVVQREIAFYLQAGSHSTANAFTHTVDELFRWGAKHPPDLERARTDLAFVRACVHETLRHHPASPVAWRRASEPTVLASGRDIAAGRLVVLDLVAANRDEQFWGEGAELFDPHRSVPESASPWGHSFGGGLHACIGQELDGGLEPRGNDGADDLYGTVAIMVAAFLEAGGRPDPENPPTLDPNSVRTHFSEYPVRFS